MSEVGGQPSGMWFCNRCHRGLPPTNPNRLYGRKGIRPYTIQSNEEQPMTYIHFIGIDVSKEWFDIAIHGAKAAKPERFPNSSEGFSALAQHFERQLPEALVVLEATGGYETALIAFLLARGVAVHRADPLTARHFLRSLRLRAKTDALDALSLARYASERHASLPLCRPGDAETTEIETLLARRADLVSMRTAERNRIQHPRYIHLHESLNAVLDMLAGQITLLEARIDSIVARSAKMAAKMQVLTSVKGVGKQTAYTLLAFMPELGTLTRRQAASLAGCAPHPRDSGKTNGYRRTTGGRAVIKRALFMAAMAAIQFNPNLKEFYEKLIKNGKKPMVAITAVMRKLITILNAKIRDTDPA